MREADFSRWFKPVDRTETATGVKIVFAKGIVLCKIACFAGGSGKARSRLYGGLPQYPTIRATTTWFAVDLMMCLQRVNGQERLRVSAIGSRQAVAVGCAEEILDVCKAMQVPSGRCSDCGVAARPTTDSFIVRAS